MDLFIVLGYRYELPSGFFMNKTLVKLKLGSGFPLQLRGANISLPMLKNLALKSIHMYDGQLQMLLSGCPALEELDMEGIRLSCEHETLSNASLKRLTIYAANCLNAFSLDTPTLVSFKYSEYVAWDYSIVNLESLVEAQIKLMIGYDQIETLISRNDDQLKDDVFCKLGKVQKLFRGICNVKKLYLSPHALQVLALCRQTMPVFKYLTFLDIDNSSMDIAWQAMPVLLRNCPQLETLVIKRLIHCLTDICGDACICIPREDKGRSLVSCPVKRLEIREFDGLTRDLEMVKHFVDYFPCLKEMEIYISDRQRFLAPLIPELNAEMLKHYNDLSGRNRDIKFKVHGTLPWTQTTQ